MKYIITGGAGFIGSECVRQLSLNPENHIYIIDKLTYAADLSRLPNNRSNIELIEEDIVNFSRISSLVKKCDFVLHFAAESHVDNSIKNGNPFIETNVGGTFAVLEECRENNIRMVMVSTDEVYGPIQNGLATENSPLNPSSIYSATKASADLLCLANIKTHNQQLIITRCCNNYGSMQHAEKFIPTVIERIKNNVNIPIYGNGKNLREWIHVSDHVRAILMLLENWRPGEIFNIGTNDRISNIDLTKMILKMTNGNFDLISYVEDRKGHDFRYALNSEKIKNLIGWAPSIPLSEGLRDLINKEI